MINFLKSKNKHLELKAKRFSYLIYSDRSLFINKRSYTVLFISILCMVIMSVNLIIFNSSLSRGKDETIYNTYGTFHASFKDLNEKTKNEISQLSYVETVDDVCVICNVDNPNENSSIKSAKMVLYEDFKSLRINIAQGNYPAKNEIMISKTVANAFSLTVDKKIVLNISFGGVSKEKEYTVSGIFSGAEACNEYIFINGEEKAEIETLSPISGEVYYDKYVTYNTKFKPYINDYTDKLIGYLSHSADDNEMTDKEHREMFLNTEVVNIKKFYQKSEFLITVFLSIIPAAISIFVFVVLDIFKAMKELSILSMTGATSDQFFKLLLKKYTYIYLIAFPIGTIISALLIGLFYLFCNSMNNNDAIYFSYYINPISILILFILCYAILAFVTHFAAKKTRAFSYSSSLSVANNRNNIFVRKSTGVIFKEKHQKSYLGLMLFIRNRKMNILFALVTSVIIAVFSYFSIMTTQQLGSIPELDDNGEFTVIPDYELDATNLGVNDEIIKEFQALDCVENTVGSYFIREDDKAHSVSAYISGEKHVSKPSRKVGAIEKIYTTDTLLLGEEYERAEELYGKYVVSGDIANLYKGDNQIAVFVHYWNNSHKSYKAGDILPINTKYIEQTQENLGSLNYADFVIGAVLYDKNDEYENTDLIRIITSNETFEYITGINSVSSLSIHLNDVNEKNMIETESQIKEICLQNSLKYENSHKEYLDLKTQTISFVIFYSMLWIIILMILIILLVSLTNFLLSSKKDSINTMYMIGSTRNELSKIYGREILLTGIVSSISGIILSFITSLLYGLISDITLSKIVSNSITQIIFIVSIIFSALITVIAPYITSQIYFIKAKYKKK